jgi:hypothetical protein
VITQTIDHANPMSAYSMTMFILLRAEAKLRGAMEAEWSGVRRPEFPLDSLPKIHHLMRWSKDMGERSRRDTERFSALCEEVGQHLREITGADL